MKYTYKDLDQRIVNTRVTLSDAIFEIIKRCKKVKVLDICKEANITAMTYYHHFHNKQQLLEYAIKKQLNGILPIPVKLKPINLKHLIYYLIFAFNKFVRENRQLIYSALKQSNENKYLGSYIDLINQIIKKYVIQEIKLLVKNDMYIEFYANIIFGSICQIFKQIIIKQISVNSNVIWTSVKNVFLTIR